MRPGNICLLRPNTNVCKVLAARSLSLRPLLLRQVGSILEKMLSLRFPVEKGQCRLS
jgi:hypothetical protein